MLRDRYLVLGFVLVTLAQSGSIAGASASPLSVVARAAAVNTLLMQGVTVNERHINVEVSAGPVHYSERNDAVVMLVEGAFSRLRYLRIVENGHEVSQEKMAEREAQNNRDLERGLGFFKQPFDQRYLSDYAYVSDANCACAAGEIAVSFRSLVRDDQHGDGVMRIDTANGRVHDVTYTPDVLPAHANSATTTETFGSPLPGRWTIVRIDREYHGHVAFFGGNGKVTETLDHFRRLPTPEAGLATLRAARYGD